MTGEQDFADAAATPALLLWSRLVKGAAAVVIVLSLILLLSPRLGAALEAMSLELAKELASESVRVNKVRRGLIDTEIHASGGDPGRLQRLVGDVPMQRIGSALEVSRAIVWLLSDESSYYTASVLDVTGGR